MDPKTEAELTRLIKLSREKAVAQAFLDLVDYLKPKTGKLPNGTAIVKVDDLGLGINAVLEGLGK